MSLPGEARREDKLVDDTDINSRWLWKYLINHGETINSKNTMKHSEVSVSQCSKINSLIFVEK